MSSLSPGGPRGTGAATAQGTRIITMDDGGSGPGSDSDGGGGAAVNTAT